MDNLSKSSKIILVVLLVSFAFWLGGYILRQLLVYQLFEAEDLSLKAIYNFNNLKPVFYTIAPAFVFNIISYVIFITSFACFVLISKIKFKEEGWFFISFLIILITCPLEIYLLVKDYNIISSLYFENRPPEILFELIKNRMTVLSSFSLIEIFSSIGLIYLFVFKPLRKEK